MYSEKFLNEIALYIQEELKGEPKRHIQIRESVMKRFHLSKTAAGFILKRLSRRKNFLILAFYYNLSSQSILYLPDDAERARKLFKETRDSIPFEIKFFNKGLHKYLLKEIRKIKISNTELPFDLLADVVKWKLKINVYTAKRLLKEIEN